MGSSRSNKSGFAINAHDHGDHANHDDHKDYDGHDNHADHKHPDDYGAYDPMLGCHQKMR